MSEIINYIASIAETMGYTGIFIMMVLESSFFPFPSEVAMIPAGYLSSIGKMDFGFALLVGTAGALVGATLNYYIGFFLGDRVVLNLVKKYGKYFFISEESYNKSKNYFQKHGGITTFTARFITVIRQLISIPAGVFKMDFKKFFILTGIGAGAWNLILMYIGYIAGKNQELIAKYSKILLIGGIVFVIIIAIIYYFINKRKGKLKNLENL
ncbi:DedA family protein [Candidatus Gracilibacteria bacterium]|nr:MAG: DedA family protein [Candidatus Gracilibacteria bacterium]